MGLAIKAELPLLAMVDELTLERGAGLVLDSLAALPPESYQLALVGEVAPDLSARLEALVGKHPEAVVHLAKVDEAGLHRLLAGADSVVLPISNGPGVLYHLKAMKYGTVPLCHEGQSHQDSVVNFDEATGSGTGITFSEPDEAAYTSALQRYILLYSREEQRTALSRNAMRHPFTWERTAGLYKQVYEGLL